MTDGLDYSTTKSPTKKIDSSVIIDLTQSNFSKSYMKDLKRSDTVPSDSFIVFEGSNRSQKTASTQEAETSTSSKLISKAKKNFKPASSVNATGKVFLYIQMQLCRRESLRDWLKDHFNRSKTEVKNIFEQIVSAVEYVHLKGLIHRDLKPSNIFFSMEGQVKIGDFGLVTGMEECSREENEAIKHTNILEKHTQAVGTQLYMSPEQLNGLNYNYKVDIYSLGVILFELLVPFRTAMERNKTLSDLRKSQFPDKFCQECTEEVILHSKHLCFIVSTIIHVFVM